MSESINGYGVLRSVLERARAPRSAAQQALVSFDDDWAAATRALIARKTYGGGAP
jgi:hypothetical protein